MKFKLEVDTRKMFKKLKDIRLTEGDMRDIEYTGSRVIVNSQRVNVPVDTAATKLSIDSHIIESSALLVVDEVGPETDYAVYLEYGTGQYAEGGQGRKGGWLYMGSDGQLHFTLGMHPRPFVRPSVIGNEGHIFRAITETYARKLLR